MSAIAGQCQSPTDARQAARPRHDSAKPPAHTADAHQRAAVRLGLFFDGIGHSAKPETNFIGRKQFFIERMRLFIERKSFSGDAKSFCVETKSVCVETKRFCVETMEYLFETKQWFVETKRCSSVSTEHSSVSKRHSGVSKRQSSVSTIHSFVSHECVDVSKNNVAVSSKCLATTLECLISLFEWPISPMENLSASLELLGASIGYSRVWLDNVSRTAQRAAGPAEQVIGSRPRPAGRRGSSAGPIEPIVIIMTWMMSSPNGRCGPMTATERSRRFRARHPTYHADWKRRRRTEIDVGVQALLVASGVQVATPLDVEIKTPLMLPAPQPPECDLLEQLAALKARTAELELLLATPSADKPRKPLLYAPLDAQP